MAKFLKYLGALETELSKSAELVIIPIFSLYSNCEQIQSINPVNILVSMKRNELNRLCQINRVEALFSVYLSVDSSVEDREEVLSECTNFTLLC
jgi:hypothetical protein